MKTATLAELREGSDLLKQPETILIKEGDKVLGYFHPLPDPDESVPIEVRRQRFLETGEKIRRQLAEKGITEEQIERDIAELFEDDRR